MTAAAAVAHRTANVATLLREAARRQPERPALIRGAERRTWAELDARVDALAAGMAARGVRQGDPVMLIARNGLSFVETLFAIFRLGAVAVPVNFRLTPADLVGMAETCDAAAIVAGAEFAAHVEAVAPRLQGAAVVLSIGELADADAEVSALVAEHRGEVPPDAPCFRGDPAWYFFTSGSSGRPKAAVLTHDQLAFVATNYLRDLLPGCGEHDVSLVVAPLSHGAGTHLLSQVAAGATSVLLASDGFDAAAAWALIREHGVTNAFTVPTILKLLVEHPDAGSDTRLRHVLYSGAPAYRDDVARARETLGDVLVQFYGMAEVTSCITGLAADRHDHPSPPGVPFGTCGTVRTGMQVQLQDEDGRAVGPDEVGEVCVAGPGVFAGYLGNPDANVSAFRDGWFRTGDLGRFDDRGYLYLTGRASDMYISGGSNIDPREVEEKLLAHPALDEVAVVGVPDPVWGEIGIAVCVPRAGAAISADELTPWMRERMADYKVPKRVLLWDALPRSAYGKITKNLVRDALRERGEID